MAHHENPPTLSRRAFVAGTAITATTWAFPAAYAQSAGPINFRVPGRAGRPLIFAQGFACALDDWAPQINALSSRFRCVALDLPGQGASAKPAAVSIAAMGTAVKDVKERIGARKV